MARSIIGELFSSSCGTLPESNWINCVPLQVTVRLDLGGVLRITTVMLFDRARHGNRDNKQDADTTPYVIASQN